MLEDLAEFCRYNKSAYFMIDGRDGDLSAKIDQLQDLRFMHLLFDGESVPDLGSRRHKVLLLDVAYLSVRRALQVDFEGWTDRSKRRRRQLVYSDGAGARIATEAKAKSEAQQPSRTVTPSVADAIPPTLPLFDADAGALVDTPDE